MRKFINVVQINKDDGYRFETKVTYTDVYKSVESRALLEFGCFETLDYIIIRREVYDLIKQNKLIGE